jgi:hypothetical protein
MPSDWIYDNIFHFSEDENVDSVSTKLKTKVMIHVKQVNHMEHHTI